MKNMDAVNDLLMCEGERAYRWELAKRLLRCSLWVGLKSDQIIAYCMTANPEWVNVAGQQNGMGRFRAGVGMICEVTYEEACCRADAAIRRFCNG